MLIAIAMFRANSIHGTRAWAEVLLVRPPLHAGSGDENNQEVEEALVLRAITTEDATIAVTRAGTIPYFADRPSIGEAIVAEARSGDRTLIVGARDDTMIDFARDLYERLGVGG